MKNKTTLILITLLTIINVLVSCGVKDAQANGAYELRFLFDRRCITNDVSIWCE